MATATVLSMPTDRPTVRCMHCELVQFMTTTGMCRRCKKPAQPPAPDPVEIAIDAASGVVRAESPEVVALADRIRLLRVNRELSQRGLAERMDVPRTYISRVECGKIVPTLANLQRLAAALGVDMSNLLGLEDEPTDFMREMRRLLPMLTETQRDAVLSHAFHMANANHTVRPA